MTRTLLLKSSSIQLSDGGFRLHHEMIQEPRHSLELAAVHAIEKNVVDAAH